MSVPFTRCDYELCKKAYSVLHKIVHELKTLYNLQEEEYKYQKGQVKKLWALAQRRKILENAAPGVSFYPYFAVNMMNSAMRADMNDIICKIHMSNKKIKDAISLVAPFYCELNEVVNAIDWTADGGMLKGDEIFKPLAYYIQNVYDWNKLFKMLMAGGEVLEDLLDIEFDFRIEAYLSHLNSVDCYRDLFAKDMCFAKLIYPK